MEIDFQAMMIWFIAAILILVREEEKKLIIASPPTNDDIPRIICVFLQDQRVLSNTREYEILSIKRENYKELRRCLILLLRYYRR